ncbi:MAG: ATP-binding cassette domain-containing protein [Xanthomonadales bacterium]|nr:ATP-binding cassette domain-containing protein [Xanthomonadales bacterium]
MIEVQALSKRYGEILAVDGVSFRVGSGEVLGFLGPNGAGKTTTMRMIAGFLTPTSGSARVCGFDVGGAAARGQAPHGLSAGRRAELRRDDAARLPRVHRRPARARGRPPSRAPARGDLRCFT